MFTLSVVGYHDRGQEIGKYCPLPEPIRLQDSQDTARSRSKKFINDFILSRIYRVAKKLISSRKEKERFTSNKITLISTNYISINATCYEGR